MVLSVQSNRSFWNFIISIRPCIQGVSKKGDLFYDQYLHQNGYIFHLKGHIHSSIRSTKNILYNIREPIKANQSRILKHMCASLCKARYLITFFFSILDFFFIFLYFNLALFAQLGLDLSWTLKWDSSTTTHHHPTTLQAPTSLNFTLLHQKPSLNILNQLFSFSLDLFNFCPKLNTLDRSFVRY